MADRPGDGPPDGPDYGWLYGGQQPPTPPSPAPTQPVRKPAPAAPPPDATRAIPVQPRPRDTAPRPVQGAPAPPPSRPVPPVLAPTPRDAAPDGSGGATTYGRARRRGWRPGIPRLRWLLLLIPAWIVYLVVVPIMSWHSVSKVDFEPDGTRPGDQPGTTYLLVGSDSRAGLSKQQERKLGTGDAKGQRTDTILLLHTGDGPNLLVSIPRDTLVDIPGHGTTKINAAFAYGGPKLLVRTIEKTTGIRIDDYAEIGLGGLVTAVDAVGGIEICPTQRVKDKLANIDIKKGCQDVDGATALGYARSRHAFKLGDIARVQHQREVIQAIGHKVLTPWSVINPIRYWKLNHAVPDSIAFGTGAGPVRAAQWVTAMINTDTTCVVPIADLAVHLDPVRSKELFERIIDDDTGGLSKRLCSPTGLPQ